MKNVYTIKDEVSTGYNPPFCATTNAEAFRTFLNLARDKSNMIGLHPGDYTLWCIGTFNEQTGILAGQEPERMIQASDLLKLNDDQED